MAFDKTFCVSVATPIKPKEIIVHQETIEELPKISFKEVLFSIEPCHIAYDKCCILIQQASNLLAAAKAIKKPVVLFNKDEAPKPKSAAVHT